ncbi:hypothetical protein Acr_00g0016860 [Actinidia rufa]|uniref:Retrotransposon gag domain-containing protein n=1 Tax=Actinidia rufa TaxID=165716 RepID=A0A7J0DB03_9ERIC|nr:hypothetical protein Acr_00g0016860 [Actinidia rufa]
MPSWYNTSPQIIHLLPPHLSQKKLIDLAILTERATRIRKIAIVLVKDIQSGAVSTNQQVCTPGKEGVLGCSDEVICKAFSATLKGSARSWFKKLSPKTIDSFGALSRLFVANFMSCKAEKYITDEELVEAKHRRRGKNDYKRKELDTRRTDYRGELKSKKSKRDARRIINEQCRRTPTYQPNIMLPPLNAPMAKVLIEIKNEDFVKWSMKIRTNPL